MSNAGECGVQAVIRRRFRSEPGPRWLSGICRAPGVIENGNFRE